LLLGQPEFKQLLAHSDELEQLRQRVIAAHHLEAMQPGEIEPYVHHRLAHVGWDGRPEVAKGLWPKLHKATGGIPRKVNQVMTRLLLLGAVEERDTIDSDMLEAVVEEMSGDAAPADAPVAKPRPDRDLPAADAIARAQDEARQPAPAPSSVDDGGAHEKGLLDQQIEAIEAGFAERDKHMAVLRREVAKLAEQRSAGDLPDDVGQRLASIEDRLDEQERSLRHVLTMMIDYFESQGSRAAA
ncbi:MAG: hypothetical protein AB3N06_03705, partial [Erythrobacter sp.]